MFIPPKLFGKIQKRPGSRVIYLIILWLSLNGSAEKPYPLGDKGLPAVPFGI